MKHILFIFVVLIVAAVTFSFIGCGGGGGKDTSGDGDTTSPLIRTLFPADGATDVSLNSNLVIAFNEIALSGTGNVSIYKSDGTPFEEIAVGSAQITRVGINSFVIDPPTDFTVSGNYYVQIDAGTFKDTSNNNFAGIADKTTWNFQAGATQDTTDSSITDFFPADNATDIALNVNLVITFDEAVISGIPGTGNVSIYDSLDNLFEAIDVASSQVTGFGTDTITVNPSSDFTASTDYYVQIDAGAFKDVANHDFAGILDKVTWSFQTGSAPDSTPPSISVLSPLDDAKDVLPTANLVITFDEAVLADAGNITIYDSGDALFEAIDVASAQVTGSGTDTITIDPTDDFSELTDYYVLIDPGAFKDTANNDFAGIMSAISWNFGVKDNTPPTISKVYPVDGATAVPTNANIIIVFSETVNAGTGNITVSDTAGVIETIDVTSGQVTGAGTDTIFIDRSDIINLTASDNHYIQIDAGAFVDTSPSANIFAGIADTTKWNFTAGTGPDSADPLISSRIPSVGVSDVPLNTNLQIKFNEVVFVESGNITVNNAGGVTETIDVTSSQVTGSWTDTITVDPNNFESTFTPYWVKIDADTFYDISGNYFVGILDSSWIFTTGGSADNTAPSVSTQSPADDATDVVLVSDLDIDFTEAVYAGSGTISIYDSGDTLIEQIDIGSAQVTGLGTANITVTPSSDFDGSTDYYVLIDATAFKDIANNYFAGISDTTTWSFTTEIGVLLTEPFGYGTTGGDLDTMSFGAWESIGAPTTKVQYDYNTVDTVDTGYTYTDYSSGTEGKATGKNDSNGGGMKETFTAGAITDEGAMYFGVLIKGLATLNNALGFGVSFYNGAARLGGVSIKGKNNPGYAPQLDDGSAPVTLAGNVNGIHLVVIKYDFTADILSGFIDPDVSQSEPAPDQTIDLSASQWTNIDRIVIDQAWNSGIANCTYGVDEIKVTKSWGLLAE